MTLDTRIAPAPVERVTPIKPSEAIRLGCLTTTPGAGEFFNGRGSACALGAMAVGLGYRGPRHGGWISGAYHLVTNALPPSLPLPSGSMAEGIHAVWMRNDSGWSRERIADWLEGSRIVIHIAGESITVTELLADLLLAVVLLLASVAGMALVVAVVPQ